MSRDVYVRTLFIQGARAVVAAAIRKHNAKHPLDTLRTWAVELADRRGFNKAAVGLANTTHRMWEVPTRAGARAAARVHRLGNLEARSNLQRRLCAQQGRTACLSLAQHRASATFNRIHHFNAANQRSGPSSIS